ncbi:receptor protein-tyrosine kinase sevenless isoform X2 [Rhynchophorus ferrugineus]|uniref:receptor protein-tyrosine kinase sevenless isoform X2 n=1 Tax=Rhynchophorus ferrugineus TaxID=354439 RepID=UPI003FCDF1C8
MNGFVITVLIYLVSQVLGTIDYEDVERIAEMHCIQHCPTKSSTDVGHYDYTCNYDCHVEQCVHGCKLWKEALSSSCQKVCNHTSDRLSKRELQCVMGCNDASAKYFSQMRALLKTPPAPALVDNSLGATSLKLEWRFPETSRARLTFHVQWRYEEIAKTWQYCRNATWNIDTSNFLVEGLQPYTKYRFRIALNLGHRDDQPIYSDQSLVIATLAAGIPASPPAQVRAAPVDAHSVSVTWEPGPFPHGPLLSYVLQIVDNDSAIGSGSRAEVKDVPSTTSFYLYRNLKPKRNYTVSVQMRNSNGPGPASTVQVSTPKEKQVTENQQPILILGTLYSIFELKHLYADTLPLYQSENTTIQGIGIHVNRQLLFLSDGNGSIWRIPIEKETKNKTKILSSDQIDFFPLDISVDWLNDQIYILGELTPRKGQGRFIIKRCNLDGTGLTVALAGLPKKPTSIEIDPCNGYLFWCIRDSTLGGIYRLDISDISNGIKHEIKVKKIINDADLGDFVVDYKDFKVLVPNQKMNTMLAVSFEGGVTNIRKKVANPKMTNVLSLGTVNSKFYWTDGKTVYNEEYSLERDTYYHNKLSHLGKTQYKNILINLSATQPWPVPVNPPTNLQAVFGSTVAKTKWHPPELLGTQGRGAWQNWSYEISVKDLTTNSILTFHTNTSSYSISNLKENTPYALKVLAYSKFGKGPWSTEFNGSTLRKERNPNILWSGVEGLFRSDSAIENLETLLHKSRMRSVGFTGISWYEDQIFMVTNNSHLYWYNLTSHKHGRLSEMDSVGSIAVDWIGRKLYWSNLKQQLIIRSNLNGSQQEPLSILTLAKEIAIDSIKAYLYWSREYVVECAHLNGEDKMEYDHLEPFSGRQVMGLTLDMDKKMVYWVVRGSDGSHLFEAPMAGYDGTGLIVKREVAVLQKANMQGPFSYFCNRLLWLQDERSAVISDLTGKNRAIVSGKSIWGLNLVYVIDKSLHPLPENVNDHGEINVIPEVVDRTSVRVIGSSENFNVTWSPVRNVNYGNVFYEVQIDGLPRNNSTIITTESTIRYWRSIAPFSRFYIAIRAFTYWATSPQIRAEILSPPSTPSAPRNLRTYVNFEHNHSFNQNQYVTVTFRWDQPLYPNGVLQGYNMRCWYINNDILTDVCFDVKIPPTQTEYTLNKLNQNQIYYLKVQAFTEIGTGAFSSPISVNSSFESPVPTILVATSDAIFIDDIDTNQKHPLLNGINKPQEITYLLKENKIFWINQIQELLMYHFASTNKTKILDLKGTPSGLALDWIERSIYYVEENIEEPGSVVYKIDLNQADMNIIKPERMFSSLNNITKIDMSPFTKKLYWIETVDNQIHKVMSVNIDGKEVEDFFSIQDRYKRNTVEEECNCRSNLNVEPTFTIDHSSSESKPIFIFINSETKDLFVADHTGCHCSLVYNEASLTSTNYPLRRIRSAVDSLYWIDTDGDLYVFNGNSSKLISTRQKVQDVLIYGKHIQPYPNKECLTPLQQSDLKPVIKKRSFNSLLLKMPAASYRSDCNITTTASTMYTIKYQESLNDEIKETTTFENVFELTNLKPFTTYNLRIAVSNHFTDEEDLVFGETVNFRTSPGAPSKPQNISAAVLNPTLAEVNWFPPKELNGDVVHYEIHWLTEGSLTGVRQKGEQPVSDLNVLPNQVGVLTTILQKLSPNETYTVWIRAYSETNETSSDSDRVQITTYPEPSAFQLINRTSSSLCLSWEITPHIHKYVVEYAPITSTNKWTRVKFNDKGKKLVEIDVEELKPKNQYKFRLTLLYDKYPEWYIWPSDSRFTFETLGDRPSPPGIPGIQFFGPSIYKVVWEASQNNGAPIELYKLECLKLKTFRNKRSTNNNRTAFFYSAPSVEEEEFTWDQVYNGTDNSWVINGLSDKYKYAFRVSALNSYGWSDPSAESTEFDISEAERISQKNPMNLIFMAILIPITLGLLIISCCLYVYCFKKCSKQKKVEHITAIQRGPDVELATLRELPRRGVHSTNILYASGAPINEDITMLPHIRRDQITLSKFLGSGAFGEVFEGRAKGLSQQGVVQKVAVKTLKKGASEQEKSEFLQEAQLMSHFKHEHILQLLGVCLDNDPQFIIMELMEGGDLLTYLRSSRNQLNNTPTLNLIELLKMCLDVTKGCKYLEEMHFVHRDLACRNCLVSSVKSENRIVKIGDFGLARDIYKNDYYRKEGEGLLPVRWMAPESLLDGVFSCQSDVWAFGVLLWEIMTLGQQPYQARSNLEVLHYVKGGGRLGKPTDCPEELYKLMLQCWEFEPDKRPTFKYCLEILDGAHRDHLRNPITGAHTQYISTVPDCVSWKSDNDEHDEASKEKIPFLVPENLMTIRELPKYLELLYDTEQESTPLENDGYEVPSHMADEEIPITPTTPNQINELDSSKDIVNYTLCGKS